MVKKEDEITYDDLVDIHEVHDYTNLLDIINVNDNEDIRESFIFRGLKKDSYDLIPSALRYDDKIEEYEINKFIIESEFIFSINRKHDIVDDDKTKKGFSFETINKFNQSVDINPKYTVSSDGEMQFRREVYVFRLF